MLSSRHAIPQSLVTTSLLFLPETVQQPFTTSCPAKAAVGCQCLICLHAMLLLLPTNDRVTHLQAPGFEQAIPSDTTCLRLGSLEINTEMENSIEKTPWVFFWGGVEYTSEGMNKVVFIRGRIIV